MPLPHQDLHSEACNHITCMDAYWDLHSQRHVSKHAWKLIMCHLIGPRSCDRLHVFGLFAGYEFLTKNGWILRCVFDLFMEYEFLTKNGWILRCVFDMFMEYEFPTKDGWILRCVFDLFTEYEFLTKNGWIFRCVFDLSMRVWISDERWIIYMYVSVLLKYFYYLWPTCLSQKFGQLHIELD